MSNGWIDRDTFSFWMPAQALVFKSSSDKSNDQDTRRWIQGIASTSSKDLEGEVISQKGIDFSYFLKYGYFNWDHKPGEDNRVGEPTQCKLTKNGLWVKGYLYPKGFKKSADDIWDHMHAIEAAGSRRRMGFSIQGKVKRRAGSTIKECWIQEIAITSCPVNTSTWAEIAKSLNAEMWDLSKACGEDHSDDDDNENKSEKAMTAAGNPLVPESLEGKKKDVNVSKKLTFEESVDLAIKSTGIGKDAAEAAVRVIFSQLS